VCDCEWRQKAGKILSYIICVCVCWDVYKVYYKRCRHLMILLKADLKEENLMTFIAIIKNVRRDLM
jgi:hypothetical protein